MLGGFKSEADEDECYDVKSRLGIRKPRVEASRQVDDQGSDRDDGHHVGGYRRRPTWRQYHHCLGRRKVPRATMLPPVLSTRQKQPRQRVDHGGYPAETHRSVTPSRAVSYGTT